MRKPRISSSPNYGWYIVGMLWFTGFLNYADRQAIFSVFPLLEKELGLDSVQLGLLGSSFALVYGICAPFAGNIVDRVRRKTAVLGGLTAWSLICSATALSRNFNQLLFFRAAEGLGETFYFPAAMSMISDYHGKRTRSRAMGTHQTSVYAGTIAGGFLGGLVAQHYGWRSSFVVFGSLGVVLALVLLKLLVEPSRGAADLEDFGSAKHSVKDKMPVGEFLRVIWTTPTVLLLMAAFALDNFVGMVLLTWMPKFLYDKFHLSLAIAGLAATIFIQLASMVGSPVGGWLADTLRRRFAGGRIAVQMIGLVGAAPFVIWCGQTISVRSLIISLTLWGFFKGMYDSNIFAAMLDTVPPKARGTAVGFMNMTGWLVGAGSAPVLVGYIAARSSLSFAISIAAIALVIASGLLLVAILGTARRDIEKVRVMSLSEASG
jgi:MFS family permease